MARLSSPLSICTSRIEMFFGETPLASGSSFFYSYDGRTFLVTNRHNLTGLDQNTGKPLDSQRGGLPNKIKFKVPLAERSGKDYSIGNKVSLAELQWGEDTRPWLEHPKLGPAADVVAIDLKKHWPEFPDVLVHANTAPNALALSIRPAMRVTVIGYPFGQTVGEHYPVWVSGSLASEPDFAADGKPAMFIDCRTNRGSSGSPVFSYWPGGLVETETCPTQEQGSFMQYGDDPGPFWGMFSRPVHRFIGIYSGRINDKADIGLVWRPEVIDEVCSTHNQKSTGV